MTNVPKSQYLALIADDWSSLPPPLVAGWPKPLKYRCRVLSFKRLVLFRSHLYKSVPQSISLN